MATTSATLTKTGPIALPPLRWAEDALAPFISRNTIGFHYGKHHKTYVDKLNELIAGTPEADMPLEDIVRRTVGDPKKLEVLHNAQQTVAVIDSLLNWEFAGQNLVHSNE